MSTFHILTLGCRINQYESRALKEAWSLRGLAPVSEPVSAGTVVVNTCAVTARAVRDARSLIRKVHRDNPDARIIVTGCAAQVHAPELADLPGVTRLVGQRDKVSLLGRTGPFQPGFPPFAVTGSDRSRAVLKIQDGCSRPCAFCIVPRTRGGPVSRPAADVLAEARVLLSSGHREIVVAGINLGQYRFADNGDLWDLLAFLERQLAPQWRGRARFRLSSLDPGLLGDRALAAIHDLTMLAPHLHVSIQSLSDTVLERMGRGHYDARGLAAFVRSLSSAWDEFGLGADLLVGFPGETGDDFAATLERASALPLTYAHVFPYSPRPGTRAATLAGQVDETVKKQRAASLRNLVSDKGEEFALSLVGRDLVVAPEPGPAPGGTSQHYVTCEFLNQAPPDCELRLVRAEQALGDRLLVSLLRRE
jgi:MiaB/RimO family radical SAM methylthiotransferase